MCLKLKSSKVGVRTAKRDLIVYKRLNSGYIPIADIKLHGKDFTGKIKNTVCTGKISIQDNRIFLCTDNEYLDGTDIDDKHGFTYSWIFDDRVISIIVDGKELMNNSLITPYKKFPVIIGETYTSLLEKERDEINKGIHSFSTADEAMCDGEGFIAKCIIPKGSKYYVGEFGNAKSYASDTLTYVKILE